MSSTESDKIHNHNSDNEVCSKANRWRCTTSDREIRESQTVGSGPKDVTKTDGVMKAAKTVQDASCDTENLPKHKIKLPNKARLGKEENANSRPLEQIINTRALSKDSLTYELEKFEKNKMIIFNHEKVNGYEDRKGTEKDVDALTTTFKSYGFEVEERKDRTKAELFSELKAFAKSDFTDYGCVAVAVLTHGTSQGLLRARDRPYCELELVNHFLHKPLLVTKPVIFIIQACRGAEPTAAIPVHPAGCVRKDIDDSVQPYTIPAEADILILHSSYLGTASHRNDLYGSWFIQSLCANINDMAASYDFESILTEVKREVAIDLCDREYSLKRSQMDVNKQMPVTTSTLMRKLYLVKSVVEEPKTSAGMVHPPCSSLLSHFNYIKTCLKYFLDENPEDTTVQNFLIAADTFKDDTENDSSKKALLRIICSHLATNAQKYPFFKYMYLPVQ